MNAKAGAASHSTFGHRLAADGTKLDVKDQ
jgi:hypothetical protein